MCVCGCTRAHTHMLEPIYGMWASADIHKPEGPLDILLYHTLLTLLIQDLSLNPEILIQTVNLDASNSQQSPISALPRAGITGSVGVTISILVLMSAEQEFLSHLSSSLNDNFFVTKGNSRVNPVYYSKSFL